MEQHYFYFSSIQFIQNLNILHILFNNFKLNNTKLDSEQDMKHWIYFEEIADKILNSIPKQNRKFVEKQLEQLDDNFFDYITYWNEKYYRNGFVDGSQLVMGCFEE